MLQTVGLAAPTAQEQEDLQDLLTRMQTARQAQQFARTSSATSNIPGPPREGHKPCGNVPNQHPEGAKYKSSAGGQHHQGCVRALDGQRPHAEAYR